MTPTAQEFINELAMSSSFTSHVVVEGISDQKLLQNSLPKSIAANIVCAGNSEAALQVAEAFETHAAKSILKLVIFVDRDYQVAIRGIDKIQNVIVTELRDIECMMFNSACLDRIIGEYISDNKLAATKATRLSIKEMVISAAAEIGCIRYASQKEKWPISFRSIEYEKFLAKAGLEVDKEKFIKHINGVQKSDAKTSNKNSIKYLTAKDYEKAVAIANECPQLAHPLLRARGHDLVAVLHFGLRKCWGNKVAGDLTVEVLEKSFHVAYPEIFTLTATYGAIYNALQK